jgi:hypothetical protein
MSKKRCTKCGRTDVRFHKHAQAKDGLKSQCVNCIRISTKKYNSTHSHKQSISAQQYKKKNKKWWDNYIKNYRIEHRKEMTAKRRKYMSIPGKRLQDILTKAKKRADKRNFKFDLDYEWIWSKWTKQDGKCKLTRLKFDLRTGRGKLPLSPSLDRINSTKGYTKRNTRLICTHLNEALNTYGETAFRKLCDAYIANKK